MPTSLFSFEYVKFPLSKRSLAPPSRSARRKWLDIAPTLRHIIGYEHAAFIASTTYTPLGVRSFAPGMRRAFLV
jgi:hypothetical protein